MTAVTGGTRGTIPRRGVKWLLEARILLQAGVCHARVTTAITPTGGARDLGATVTQTGNP